MATDGAPNMIDRRGGLVAFLRQHMGKENLLSYNCMIRQQALSVKEGCVLQETMQIVVNFIRARGLIHRKFQSHPAALVDVDGGDVQGSYS